MTGALTLREDSHCGILIGCWHLACGFSFHLPNDIHWIIRLSTPFSPPTKQYIPLEDIVKKVPNYAYQLYLADPDSTKEIEANVRATFQGSVPMS